MLVLSSPERQAPPRLPSCVKPVARKCRPGRDSDYEHHAAPSLPPARALALMFHVKQSSLTPPCSAREHGVDGHEPPPVCELPTTMGPRFRDARRTPPLSDVPCTGSRVDPDAASAGRCSRRVFHVKQRHGGGFRCPQHDSTIPERGGRPTSDAKWLLAAAQAPERAAHSTEGRESHP